MKRLKYQLTFTIMFFIIVMNLSVNTGCGSKKTEDIKRIADALEKPKYKAINYDSIQNLTDRKVDTILLYFDKAMQFSMKGQSDSCKKYLEVMKAYSRKENR